MPKSCKIHIEIASLGIPKLRDQSFLWPLSRSIFGEKGWDSTPVCLGLNNSIVENGLTLANGEQVNSGTEKSVLQPARNASIRAVSGESLWKNDPVYLLVHPTDRKWVITPVISGLTPLIPFITRVITHLLTGMSHQVARKWLKKSAHCTCTTNIPTSDIDNARRPFLQIFPISNVVNQAYSLKARSAFGLSHISCDLSTVLVLTHDGSVCMPYNNGHIYHQRKPHSC